MFNSHTNVIAAALELSKKLKQEVFVWLADAMEGTYWNVSPIAPVESPYYIETVQAV